MKISILKIGKTLNTKEQKNIVGGRFYSEPVLKGCECDKIPDPNSLTGYTFTPPKTLPCDMNTASLTCFGIFAQ